MFCKKVILTISGKLREVTCGFSLMPEKSFEAVHFSYNYISSIFQGFYLDFKLYCFNYILDFQGASIFQTTSFSLPFMVAGLGIKRQLNR